MNASPDLGALAMVAKASISLPMLIGQTVQLRREGRYRKGCCPFHDEKTPSFYVYDDHFHCFGCGAHGDVIEWIMRTRRVPFPEALLLLGGTTVQGPQLPPPAAKPATRDRGATADLFLRCWNQGVDPAGSLVETYLRNRGGLRVPVDAPIRFHPRCQRGRRDLVGGPEFWPAMLALMTDPITGKPVGLHRTYLRHDGRGKAPEVDRVDSSGAEITLTAKRIMGTWGVVRLAPEDDLGSGIAISEGIENALTAWQIMGWHGVWAAGTRNCVASFPVLRWAEAITIFADADDSGVGIDAARACAARWTEAGREALIHIPPAGRDWNDVARGRAA